MGTRHLVAVFVDGDYKVAQYGQWDGYPSGQGADVLRFLREAWDREKFLERVRACRWLTEEEAATVNLDPDWPRHYPWLSRDMGAKILWWVQDRSEGVPLGNALWNGVAFAADSLFCEWAYVVDLDAGTLEVFKGFQKGRLSKNERFKGLEDQSSEGYAPVKRVAVFSLDALPAEEAFVATCEGKDEEEGLPA